MKIILFRSNNIFDSRVNKYYNYYERAGIDYTIVGWDRKCEGLQRKRYDFFRCRAGEAVGGVRAMRNHIRWMLFVYKYLKSHKYVTTVHACDLNSAFPAAVFKALHKNEATLIFDACDWFSSNFAHYRMLSKILKWMERYTCNRADELVICEPERKAQIQFKLKKEPLVMPNIPEIDMKEITDVQAKYKFDNDNPTLAYVGGFTNGRFLMELFNLAETEPFNLLIAGSGVKEYEDRCNELNNRENVRFFGRVNMVDGLNMENAADVIFAMYCKINPNHVYAAPNKYYEAMMLGKPLITTKGTIPGDKVVRHGTGWAVEEDIEDLQTLLNGLKEETMKEKGRRALKLWNEEFRGYLRVFFDNTYTKIIR